MSEKPQQNSALERLERLATGSTVAETITSILKAGLSTAPFTGGIASLISDYIPSARMRRLEEFAADIASRGAGSPPAPSPRRKPFATASRSLTSGAAGVRTCRLVALALPDPGCTSGSRPLIHPGSGR